jgi:hypothetical protein
VRAYAATLKSQPAGVGVECWKLADIGQFERYPEPVADGEEWAPPPFDEEHGPVEDLGPVEPRTYPPGEKGSDTREGKQDWSDK